LSEQRPSEVTEADIEQLLAITRPPLIRSAAG
jgi:hypothetical protein